MNKVNWSLLKICSIRPLKDYFVYEQGELVNVVNVNWLMWLM